MIRKERGQGGRRKNEKKKGKEGKKKRGREGNRDEEK